MSGFTRKVQRNGFGNVQILPKPVNVKVELKIQILHNGQVRLEGPLTNKKLCEAMLLDAMKVVNKFSAESEAEEKAENLIVEPDKKIILPNG